jgi:hypothetical protein
LAEGLLPCRSGASTLRAGWRGPSPFLGAVWCGVHPREPRVEGLRRLFGVPEGINPHSLVLLGYPAEQRQSEDRYEAGRVRRTGRR